MYSLLAALAGALATALHRMKLHGRHARMLIFQDAKLCHSGPVSLDHGALSSFLALFFSFS